LIGAPSVELSGASLYVLYHMNAFLSRKKLDAPACRQAGINADYPWFLYYWRAWGTFSELSEKILDKLGILYYTY